MSAAFAETPGSVTLTVTMLRGLAAEGVSPWLEGVPGFRPDRLHTAARRLGVRGLLCARPGTVAEARQLCDALLPEAGLVALPPAPEAGGDSPYCAARALAGAVDRPNLVVSLPATAEGLAATARLLGEGTGVLCGPVTGPAAYEGLLDAWLCGLERAQDRELDLAAIPAFAAVRIRPLGPAAAPVARRLYARYEALLGTERWRALARAGARPHRLMWTALGRRAAALPELIGWGTAAALTPRAVDILPALRGDTLTRVWPDSYASPHGSPHGVRRSLDPNRSGT
ncbi:hypothetical protein [Streptomyces sp. NPDC002054]|uniref:hypothetical protein n=1 Tax=Streptomyces sp. NPDC002054 TaxID=3154663 RepID=UPI0033187005